MRSGLGSAALAGVALAAASCAAPDATIPPIKVYLEQARTAVQQRNAPAAEAALDHAHSVWVSRNVPFTSPFFIYDPTALRAMDRARQSIEMQRWDDAGYYVCVALRDPSILAR